MPTEGRTESRSRRRSHADSDGRPGDSSGRPNVQLKGRGATLKPRPEGVRAVLLAHEGAQAQGDGDGGFASSSLSESEAPRKVSMASMKLKVSGCTHNAVRGIICGEYASETSNHNKPVYRKVDGKQSPQVLIYFWDSRHGADQSGWWFGPEIGGEKVWAHNASAGSGSLPPGKGWRVPHDGDVDELVVEAVGDASSSESDEPEEAPTGTAPRTDSRKGAAGVADEVEPKKANSKAASRPRDRGPEFSFSALAKRKQEERLQAERLKKDEERAKRKEDLKRDDAPQITEEQKLKLNELKKKQEELGRR